MHSLSGGVPMSEADVAAPLPKLYLNALPVGDTNAALLTPPPESPVDASLVVRRKLGDSELSYFLPSRADGVNDMYLHLGMTTAADVFAPARVDATWALLRLRHPLLASAVEMGSGDYSNASFVYTPPSDVKEALKQAQGSLSWSTASSHDLIDTYLNGPRTLSHRHLSHLIVSRSTPHEVLTPPATPNLLPSEAYPGPNTVSATPSRSAISKCEVNLLICAVHFIGDGMALHTFASELLQLLAGVDEETGTVRSEAQLLCLLREEWDRCYSTGHEVTLPSSLEQGLVPRASASKLVAAVADVDFLLDQRKYIGGHSFPRAATKKPRNTVLQVKTFDRETTSKMLKKCKANGVSISTTLFAACSIAWARMRHASSSPTLPMMMYSAINLRPHLPRQNSYWFLAVGYFNVVLPTFLPDPQTTSTANIFWHRARSAKAQSAAATSTKMIVSRAAVMAEQRGRRARTWAREDDGLPADPADAELPVPEDLKPGAPSRALVGLSLLGNLDGMYKHAAFPAAQLHTLNTGSRQRPGGMLMFAYTFVGRLWLSFGWDVNGYDAAVVERFWHETGACLQEFVAEA